MNELTAANCVWKSSLWGDNVYKMDYLGGILFLINLSKFSEINYT